MATFGNTIIGYEELEKADLRCQVEAITDLSRLATLVLLGQRHELEGGGLPGDEALLHSLLWPVHSIAERALEKMQGVRANADGPGAAEAPRRALKLAKRRPPKRRAA